jgi:urea carboxylase-associated protein 1
MSAHDQGTHEDQGAHEHGAHNEVVAAGEPWIGTLAAGQILRIVDLEGNQAVDTLFYNAHDTAERYSAVDTIRAQGNIYLGTGSALRSNLGATMLTIVEDTCGRHDTLGGACSAESNTVRYALDKRYMHSCRDNFLLALARHDRGLGKRDLPSNINFFMNVPVTPEGGLTFADGISAAGRYVQLRAHMDVLVLISNCPQLNNPCNAYNPTPIQIQIRATGCSTRS